MLTRRHIGHMIGSGQYPQLLRRVLANGRCSDPGVLQLLSQREVVQIAALGLALQRWCELAGPGGLLPKRPSAYVRPDKRAQGDQCAGLAGEPTGGQASVVADGQTGNQAGGRAGVWAAGLAGGQAGGRVDAVLVSQLVRLAESCLSESGPMQSRLVESQLAEPDSVKLRSAELCAITSHPGSGESHDRAAVESVGMDTQSRCGRVALGRDSSNLTSAHLAALACMARGLLQYVQTAAPSRRLGDTLVDPSMLPPASSHHADQHTVQASIGPLAKTHRCVTQIIGSLIARQHPDGTIGNAMSTAIILWQLGGERAFRQRVQWDALCLAVRRSAVRRSERSGPFAAVAIDQRVHSASDTRCSVQPPGPDHTRPHQTMSRQRSVSSSRSVDNPRSSLPLFDGCATRYQPNEQMSSRSITTRSTQSAKGSAEGYIVCTGRSCRPGDDRRTNTQPAVGTQLARQALAWSA